MKQRKNYIIQLHLRSCWSCKNRDAIRESIIHGDKGKVKFMICMLDHEEVEKSGVCDFYRSR